jgi:NitT/TauT family transport system substrate-binding protein/putative hydroxymethylpyrimidine transport system substrate-binding protein
MPLPHRRPISVFALLLAVVVGLSACGGGDDTTAATTTTETAAKTEKVVLALDFTPNPVHAPIYMAVENGHDRRRGVELEIQKPGSGPNSVKLVASGRVDVGVLDIQDLALAREQGTDLVAIGALVNRPLAALIARPEIKTLKDLEGKRVGVSGLPSDPAFIKAMLQHEGVDYASVKQVTIGFNAVSSLISGKVVAVPAFWNAEGVALRERGLDVREFRIEDYGAPPFPEVVLITARKTLEQHRERLVAALDAIEAGRRDTVGTPDAAVHVIANAAEAKDTTLVQAQMDAVKDLFAPGLRFDRPVLQQWADWVEGIGIVGHRPDVARAFDFSLRG